VEAVWWSAARSGFAFTFTAGTNSAMAEFVKRSRISAPAEEVFRWHARPGALERLTPPWTTLELIERSGGIENGARVGFNLPVGPTHVRWVAEHRDYVDGRQFHDVQIEGPFARWEHMHRFEPDGPSASCLEDRITYELPFGAVGRLIGGASVRAMLERTFTYRHATTAQDLAAHAAYSGVPLHIAVTGSTGLVGAALIPFLTTGGHRVTRLVRSTVTGDENTVLWNPVAGTIDAAGLEGVDAVVHLAGESVAGARWNDAVKARILESRRSGTTLLCETLARLRQPPKVFISASAIGYYGDRGDEVLLEDSAGGTGFLAEVCRQWEAATVAAEQAGIRVVHLRIGIVLSPAGGALKAMLMPFKLGAGGRIGSGAQYMSWISIDDLIGAILHALRTEKLSGAVNAVAPNPATNAALTRVLGRVLRRPTIFPIPAAAARLAFGAAADEMLLASARVQPVQLQTTNYAFRHAGLEAALRHVLGR
jgi:uncharacterized protein (TIGR01777 family)